MMLKRIALMLIRFYKQCISPYLGGHCRFVPTCSEYAYEAIETYGFFKGSYLAARRILRCNPFTPPGYDPVPPKKIDK